MKKIFLFIFLLLCFSFAFSQTKVVIHSGAGGHGSGIDSASFHTLITVNDTTFVLVRPNGLKDTLVVKTKSGLIKLKGDATASGTATTTDSVSIILSTVNSLPGSYGDATHVPQIVINGKGLSTSSANVLIQIPESQVTNLLNDLTLKANLSSPNFTGTPSLPTGTTGVTQSAGNNSSKLATTAYADAIAALKANLSSPNFTGTPTTPNVVKTDSSTIIPNTKFVHDVVNDLAQKTDTTNVIHNGSGPWSFYPSVTGDSLIDKTFKYGVINNSDSTRSIDTTVIASKPYVDAIKLLLFSTAKTANYTLVLGDAGTGIQMNISSANTLTVPLNSSVAFPIGTTIVVEQLGAGATTITPISGVTLHGLSLVTGGQYGTITLIKKATDEWLVL